MAITTSTLQADARNRSGSVEWAMTLAKSDANYLEDNVTAGKEVVTQAITLDIATEAVKVMFLNGRTHTFPAGVIAAGVPFPCNIIRLYSTGTGSNVVVTGLF